MDTILKEEPRYWKPAEPTDDERREILDIANRQEARDELDKMVAGFKVLAHTGVVKGLYEGLYGHVSVRVPGAPNCFWVNSVGARYSEMTRDKMVLLTGDGKIIDGRNMRNFAAFFIHAAIHAARPDINCVVHHHSRAACAFSALGVELEPIDQVGCSFYEDHALHSEYSGVIANADQGSDIVNALGDKRSLILTSHGLITCGKTVEQAIIDYYELERTCDVQLLALSTGRPLQQIPPEAARQVRKFRTDPRRYLVEWGMLMDIIDDGAGGH
ncbi:MAG: class II aldolase/adducin family protein [Pseudomonadota bacterium]